MMIPTVTDVLFWVVLLMVVGPVFVFYCVKVGAYAWFAGRDAFIQERKKRHGK